MAEYIPDDLKTSLCVFKGLRKNICQKIIKLILLLYREFCIQISAEIEVKVIRIEAKRKGKNFFKKDFYNFKDIITFLQSLIAFNTIDSKEIK